MAPVEAHGMHVLWTVAEIDVGMASFLRRAARTRDWLVRGMARSECGFEVPLSKFLPPSPA